MNEVYGNDTSGAGSDVWAVEIIAHRKWN